MKIKQSKIIFIAALFAGIALLSGGCASTPISDDVSEVDLSESMKQSLVFLEITNSGYDQYQPWKQTPVGKDGGYGCAVGPYEILTTAENTFHFRGFCFIKER